MSATFKYFHEPVYVSQAIVDPYKKQNAPRRNIICLLVGIVESFELIHENRDVQTPHIRAGSYISRYIRAIFYAPLFPLLQPVSHGSF